MELDPVHELEVLQEMERRGLARVGWYHSHPVFRPNPSLKDMDNQRNQQALFRDEARDMWCPLRAALPCPALRFS